MGFSLLFLKVILKFSSIYLRTKRTICRTDNDTYAQKDISILTLINPECLTARTQATACRDYRPPVR